MVRTYRYNPALTSTFCLAHARGAEDFQTLAHETHLERLASERKKAATALRRRQPKRDLLDESEVFVDDERDATCEKHSGQLGPLQSKAKNPCRSGNDHHLYHKCLHEPREHFYCRHCMGNPTDRECIAHCSNWPCAGNGTDQYFCCADPNGFYGYSGELCNNAFYPNLHNRNCLITPYAPSFPWMRPADWQATFSNSRIEANRNYQHFRESGQTPSADLSSVPQLNATLPDERVAHDYDTAPKLPIGYSTISTTSPMCRQCAALQSCTRKPYPSMDGRKESQATDLLNFLNRQDRPTMIPTHRLAVPTYPICCHVEEAANHSCRYLCPYCAEKRHRQNSDERIREDDEAPLDSARISPEDASHCLSCSTVSSGMASLQKEKKNAKQQYDDELMQQIEEKRHAKEQQLIKEREEDRKLIQAIEAVLAKEKQEVYEEQRTIGPHSLKQERYNPTQSVKKSAKPDAIPDSRPDDIDSLEWWEKQPEVYKPQTPSTPSEPVPALRFNSYHPRDFEEPLDLKESQTVDTSFDDAWVQESIDETEKRKSHQTKPKRIRRRYSRWSDWSEDEETNESQKAQQSQEGNAKTERPKQRPPSDFAMSQKKAIKERKFPKARAKLKQSQETKADERRPTEQQLERETTTIETEDFSSQVDFPDPELDDEQPQTSEHGRTPTE
ncbi:hypothetical protein TTRE_0000269401 [Trichuris trichiura]|uniref:Uncharacterized protein n=1 Tax=Trichuris trichiura TaxID=36087 RepID=A0A077Z3J8_TRITR|nr:hypothetical protein TTRE_0000269401 [Trichuris trichiura]